MTKVSTCSVPRPSEIADRLADATFYDSYALALRSEDTNASAAELSVRIFSRSPNWVRALMRLRNRIVGVLGLKNQGDFTPDAAKKPIDYRVGDRLGFFTVFFVSEQEFIFGDDDKHLKVQVSACRVPHGTGTDLVVTTVVHEKNWLGAVYMFFVGPAHKIIAPATLRQGY